MVEASVLGLILTVILVLTICCSFVLSGHSLLSRALAKYRDMPACLQISLAYFTGLTFFLCSMRLLAAASSHLKLSCLVAGFLVLAIASQELMERRLTRLRHSRGESIEPSHSLKKKTVFKLTILFLMSSGLVFSFWFMDGDAADVYASLGSLHSGRYANLSSYMLVQNTIPIVNQNYGQSLLVAASMIIGYDKPLFLLSAWLTVSVFMVILLLQGSARYLGFNPFLANLAAFIVLLGNSSLSLLHVLSIDSGSPLILNGYTDTLTGVGTLFLALYLLAAKVPSDVGTAPLRTITTWVIIFSIGFIWNLSAPQNIVILVPIAVLASSTSLYQKFRGQRRTGVPFTLSFTGFLMLGTLIGAFFGGMLTPKTRIQSLDLPGLMAAQGNSEGLKFSMCLVHISMPQQLHDYQKHCSVYDFEKFLDNKVTLAWKNTSEWSEAIAGIYDNLIIAFRATFFPIIGISILAMVSFLRYLVDKKSVQSIEWQLLTVSILTFTMGFVLAFAFKYNTYKWELTRFLIPGLTLGSLCFAAGFCHILRIIGSKKYGLILALPALILAITPTFGPMRRATIVIRDNFAQPRAELVARMNQILYHKPN